MKIEISEKQKKLILSAVERYRYSIWDDPEIAGFCEEDYESEDEMEKAIEIFMKNEVDSLIKMLS